MPRTLHSSFGHCTPWASGTFGLCRHDPHRGHDSDYLDGLFDIPHAPSRLLFPFMLRTINDRTFIHSDSGLLIRAVDTRVQLGLLKKKSFVLPFEPTLSLLFPKQSTYNVVICSGYLLSYLLFYITT